MNYVIIYNHLIIIRVSVVVLMHDIVLFAACDHTNSTRNGTASTPCLSTGEMILDRYQLHEVHYNCIMSV